MSTLTTTRHRYPIERQTQVRKRDFLRHFILKKIILPRQARDKHRENSELTVDAADADAEDQAGRPWNAPPLDPAEMTVRAIASVAATELDRLNSICQDTPQTDSNLTRQLQLMFFPPL